MYLNPDLADNNFYCLMTAMATLQSVDEKATFLFVGDVNAHHEEWLWSSTTNFTVGLRVTLHRHQAVRRCYRVYTHWRRGSWFVADRCSWSCCYSAELARKWEPQIIVSRLWMLYWSSLFFTWCVSRRSIWKKFGGLETSWDPSIRGDAPYRGVSTGMVIR